MCECACNLSSSNDISGKHCDLLGLGHGHVFEPLAKVESFFSYLVNVVLFVSTSSNTHIHSYQIGCCERVFACESFSKLVWNVHEIQYEWNTFSCKLLYVRIR